MPQMPYLIISCNFYLASTGHPKAPQQQRGRKRTKRVNTVTPKATAWGSYLKPEDQHHECPVPGCGKVYGRSDPARSHLRKGHGFSKEAAAAVKFAPRKDVCPHCQRLFGNVSRHIKVCKSRKLAAAPRRVAPTVAAADEVAVSGK